MRFFVCFLVAVSIHSLVYADPPPIEVEVIGTPADHQVQWTSRPCYSYSFETSTNLTTWTDCGVLLPGTGDLMAQRCQSATPSARRYYRVREHNFDFLTRPQPGEAIIKEDGVCFAFDLADVPQLNTLAKICISKRTLPNGAWCPIGKLTGWTADGDFATAGDGSKFVRGPCVWIPDEEGNFEVKAVAYNSNSTPQILCTVTRQITIGHNNPPTVTITGGPPPTSTAAQPMTFTTAVGDTVRRVDFYDNGLLMGTDRDKPFGNALVDLRGEEVPVPAQVLKGTHAFTAKAYDSYGAESATSNTRNVTITGTVNSRPALEITSPDPAVRYDLALGSQFFLWYAASDPDGATGVHIKHVVVESIGGNYYARDNFAISGGALVNSQTLGLGSHTLIVYATDTSDAVSYPRYFDVNVFDPANDFAEDLASRIADETTALPSDVAFSGIVESSGLFSNGTISGLQMDSGALLTTGLFSSWNGGDNSNNTEWWWTVPGDADLEDRIAGNFTRDRAALEFDLDCLHGQLELEIQFGSEEYSEYVSEADNGLCHNDAFMVTVDGVVVSLVPDCGDIIAVNSVHRFISYLESVCGQPDLLPQRAHLYLDDEADIKPLVTLIAPANLEHRVEYDGMTINLRLHAFVTSNATHHIRVVIADVNDVRYDSALFLREGSLRTVNPAP